MYVNLFLEQRKHNVQDAEAVTRKVFFSWKMLSHLAQIKAPLNRFISIFKWHKLDPVPKGTTQRDYNEFWTVQMQMFEKWKD